MKASLSSVLAINKIIFTLEVQVELLNHLQGKH
jgi:hypothetical protein